MISITGYFSSDGAKFQRMVWGPQDEELLTITVNFYKKLSTKQAISEFKTDLKEHPIDWIFYQEGKCHIDLEKLKIELNLNEVRTRYPAISSFDFMTGIVVMDPEIEDYERDVFRKKVLVTKIFFEISKETIMNVRPRKIFLSHKGIDKPEIREYKKTLESLGFDPWLDEDSLIAGVDLERGLLKGIKDSCAVIFFLTENYKDENYLATEIDYAIAEKREKGDRFAIITLVLNEKATVPDLLKKYVWKTPQSQFEAIREIIKALPLKLGLPDFNH